MPFSTTISLAEQKLLEDNTKFLNLDYLILSTSQLKII